MRGGGGGGGGGGGARSRIYASNLNYYSKSKDSDFTMFNIIVPN